MPEPYRSSTPAYGVPTVFRSIAGTNTPAELRILYGAPLQNLGSSKGLLTASALFPGDKSDISPVDLYLANSALGADSNFTSLTSPPFYVPNNPLNVYGPLSRFYVDRGVVEAGAPAG